MKRGGGRTAGMAGALALGLLAGPAAGQAAGLADTPFWKTSAGWWVSDNTYFSPAMDYNIRAYNSIVHIAVEGGRVRETEYKFYAPSKLAVGAGKGRVSDQEGIEMVTVSLAEQAGEGGAVRYVPTAGGPPPAAGSRVDVLGPADAVRVVPGPGAVDEYRMYVSLPTPDRRYIANYGIVSHSADGKTVVGDLRGFSVFRARRIQAADFARLRRELRERNKVAAIVTTGADGKPVVERLD